jgi:membrane protein
MQDSGRGREADRPRELGRRGWKDVLWRVRREMKQDHLTLLAGGVAFYAFLSLFPMLFALVSLYALVADPADVERQIASFGSVLPGGIRDILREQMTRLAGGSQGAGAFGVIAGVVLAIWSAQKGVKGITDALNVVYEERERRGFFKRSLLNLGLTLGAVVAMLVAIGLVAAAPVALDRVGLGAFATWAIALLRWPALAALVLGGISIVYRLGPSRDKPQWRWVTPGSVLATVLWIAGSIGFSIYVENFGKYNETYGTLGAVAVLLLWLWLSAYVVLLGAEVNAEAEHQTREDSTVGPPEPMGERGARMADTLGESKARA